MSDLLTRAKEIKNATEIGENTAERVGGVMVDMVMSIMSAEESLTAQDAQIDELKKRNNAEIPAYTGVVESATIKSGSVTQYSGVYFIKSEGRFAVKVGDEYFDNWLAYGGYQAQSVYHQDNKAVPNRLYNLIALSGGGLHYFDGTSFKVVNDNAGVEKAINDRIVLVDQIVADMSEQINTSKNLSRSIEKSVSPYTRSLELYPKYEGAITYDGKWSQVDRGTAYYIIIPVNPQDELYLKSKTNDAPYIAFVTDYKAPVDGELLLLSSEDGYNERLYAPTSGKNYIVPNDCNYIIAVVSMDNIDREFGSFMLNGYDVLKDNIKSSLDDVDALKDTSRILLRSVSFNDKTIVQGYDNVGSVIYSSKRVCVNFYIPIVENFKYKLFNAEEFNSRFSVYDKDKKFYKGYEFFTRKNEFISPIDGFVRVSLGLVSGENLSPEYITTSGVGLENSFFDNSIEAYNSERITAKSLDREIVEIDLNAEGFIDNRYINVEGKPITYDSNNYRISKDFDVTEGDLIYVEAFCASPVSVISFLLPNENKYEVIRTGEGVRKEYYYIVPKDGKIAISFNKTDIHVCRLIRLNNAVNTKSFNRHKTSFEIEKNDKAMLNIAYSQIGIAPINTAEHFIAVAHCGFNAAKADIEITSDNVLICCHDEGFTFDENGRIVGKYEASNSLRIRELTWNTISQYEYASMYNELGYYSKVCTIDKYLKICKEYALIPFITLRSHDVDEVLAQLFPLLRKYWLESVAIINIFPPSIEKCRKVRAYSESVKICYTNNYGADLTHQIINQLVDYSPVYFGLQSSRIANGVNTELIPIARENGIRVVGYDVNEEYYQSNLNAGVIGGQITRPLLPYTPKRVTFLVTVDDSGDTLIFRNRESQMLTADLSINKESKVVTVKNIRKTYSGYGFIDGVIPLLMNRLPYVISVIARNIQPSNVNAYWSNNELKIQLESLTYCVYEISIDV